MGEQLQAANEDYYADQQYIYKLEKKNKVLTYILIGLSAAVITETAIILFR
jgi:hypothetical protein